MTRTAQNNAGGGLQTSNYFSLLGSKKVGKSSAQPSNQAKKTSAPHNASQQKQPQERGDHQAPAKQKTSQHVMSLDNTVANDNPKKDEDKKKTSAQIKKEKEEKDHHVDRSTKGHQSNKGGVGPPHNEKDLIAEGQGEIAQQDNADAGEEKKENRNRKPKKEEAKPEEEEDPTKDYVTYDDFIKQKTSKAQVDTGLLQKQRKVNATNLKGMAKKDNGKHTEETYMVIPQKKEQTQQVQQPAKKGTKAPVVTEKEKKKPQHNQELFQKMFWMPPKVQRSYEPRKDRVEPKKEEGEQQQGAADNQQPKAEGESPKPEETQPETTENANTTENTDTWGDGAWGSDENNTKDTKEAGEAVDNNNNNQPQGDYNNRGRGRGGRGRGGRSYNNYEGGGRGGYEGGRGYEGGGRGYEGGRSYEGGGRGGYEGGRGGYEGRGGRGYRGRGGGGGRGGRGGGGGRNFQRTEYQSTPNLGDNDAFPSLGGK